MTQPLTSPTAPSLSDSLSVEADQVRRILILTNQTSYFTSSQTGFRPAKFIDNQIFSAPRFVEAKKNNQDYIQVRPTSSGARFSGHVTHARTRHRAMM